MGNNLYLCDMKQICSVLMMLCDLWLLMGCSADNGQMLRQLEELEQMNRADSVMRNDSLAEDLVAYFDKHGTPNERMRAHYILGRTYFDLGELPRALETYLDAVGCADTTATDCDYKTLSRIHAQSAEIYFSQLQPQSALNELKKAVHSARIANDTLQAIECYSQQADAYKMLHCHDSVISIKEGASKMYLKINQPERSAKKLGGAISSLLHNNDLERAKRFIQIYESNSGLFNESGNIISGREIYYYIKGEYYLAIGRIDSAEYMFRKELGYGKDLNNQIAGSKGLQKVYVRMGISDSIAKYASLGYELNDSAYSLSEVQNIQRLQASYNYDHQKHLADQNEEKAQRLLWLLTGLVVLVILLSLIAYQFFDSNKNRREAELQQYKNNLEALEKLQIELQEICSEEPLSPSEMFEKKHDEIVELLSRIKEYKRKDKKNTESLEDRLTNALIVRHLKELANSNPYQKASYKDMKDLRNLINEEIPQFYTSLNTPKYTLTPIEYEVSMMVRVHLSPSDIWKLAGISKGYASNLRSRLLLKIYGIDGSPKDYNQKVLAIR